MRTAMLVVGLLALFCSSGMAGPNERGSLILHYHASVAYSDVTEFAGELTDCEAAITEIPPALSFPPPDEEKRVWYAYVAFPPGNSPRVKALEFGLSYPVFDGAGVRILSTAFPPGTIASVTSNPPWPEPDSGVALVFDQVLTAEVNAICAFAGYGSAGTALSLIRNPEPQFGNTIWDDVPSDTRDFIIFRGAIGFGVPGTLSCPPIVQGACCTLQGNCSIATPSVCAAAGSFFLGASTVCNPNSCTPYMEGACCTYEGSCSVLSPSDCAASGAIYLVEFAACDPNPCPPPPGACCLPDGTCRVLPPQVCESYEYQGIHQGADTACELLSCPQPPPPTLGACCDRFGGCVETVQWGCSEDVWMIGESCSPNPCADINQQVACCNPRTGECSYITVRECFLYHPGYEWTAGECSPNPCGGPYPIGACCYGSGECRLQSEANCSTGDWHSEEFCHAVSCAVPEDYGACCMPDFGCEVLRQAHCETGEWFADQPCAAAPCAPVFGACCLENGQCVYAQEESCPTEDWHVDEACFPSLCPQPSAACCLLPLLQCVILTEQECVEEIAPAIWMGVAVECDPDPCAAYAGFGACCTDTCSFVSQENCAVLEGVWHEGAPCAPNPCPQPAVDVMSWGKIKTRFR